MHAVTGGRHTDALDRVGVLGRSGGLFVIKYGNILFAHQTPPLSPNDSQRLPYYMEFTKKIKAEDVAVYEKYHRLYQKVYTSLKNDYKELAELS